MGGKLKAHKARADVLEGRLAGSRVVLAKPRTYMNVSGGPVAGLRDFFKVPLERLVVVHDELDLPFGGLRLKLGGGDNGHNGLKSIRRSLGSGTSTGCGSASGARPAGWTRRPSCCATSARPSARSSTSRSTGQRTPSRRW